MELAVVFSSALVLDHYDGLSGLSIDNLTCLVWRYLINIIVVSATSAAIIDTLYKSINRFLMIFCMGSWNKVCLVIIIMCSIWPACVSIWPVSVPDPTNPCTDHSIKGLEIRLQCSLLMYQSIRACVHHSTWIVFGLKYVLSLLKMKFSWQNYDVRVG